MFEASKSAVVDPMTNIEINNWNNYKLLMEKSKFQAPNYLGRTPDIVIGSSVAAINGRVRSLRCNDRVIVRWYSSHLTATLDSN